MNKELQEIFEALPEGTPNVLYAKIAANVGIPVWPGRRDGKGRIVAVETKAGPTRSGWDFATADPEQVQVAWEENPEGIPVFIDRSREYTVVHVWDGDQFKTIPTLVYDVGRQ